MKDTVLISTHTGAIKKPVSSFITFRRFENNFSPKVKRISRQNRERPSRVARSAPATFSARLRGVPGPSRTAEAMSGRNFGVDAKISAGARDTARRSPLRASQLGAEEGAELRRQVERLKQQVRAREARIRGLEDEYVNGGLQKRYNLRQLELQQARGLIAELRSELDSAAGADSARRTLQQRVGEMQAVMNATQLESDATLRAAHADHSALLAQHEDLQRTVADLRSAASERERRTQSLETQIDAAQRENEQLADAIRRLEDGREVRILRAKLARVADAAERKAREAEAASARAVAAEAQAERLRQEATAARSELRRDLDQAIEAASGEAEALRTELKGTKAQLEAAQADRADLVRRIETSGTEAVDLREQLRRVEAGYGMAEAAAECRELKAQLRLQASRQRELVDENNALSRATQALRRERTYLIDRASLPKDWALDARAASAAAGDEAAGKAKLLHQEKLIQTLEAQRSQLLEQLNDTAIGVSKDGFRFLGLTPDQTQQVQEFAKALREGTESQFYGGSAAESKERAELARIRSTNAALEAKCARAEVARDEALARLSRVDGGANDLVGKSDELQKIVGMLTDIKKGQQEQQQQKQQQQQQQQMTAGTESKTKAKDEAKAGTRGVSDGGSAMGADSESKNEGKASAETRAVTEAKSTDEINADSKGGTGAVQADAKGASSGASRSGDAGAGPTASKEADPPSNASGSGSRQSQLRPSAAPGRLGLTPKASQKPRETTRRPADRSGITRDGSPSSTRAATPPPSERKKPPTVSALQAEGPASAAESSATLASSRLRIAQYRDKMSRLASEHKDLARAHEQARLEWARRETEQAEAISAAMRSREKLEARLAAAGIDPESDDGAQGDSKSAASPDGPGETLVTLRVKKRQIARRYNVLQSAYAQLAADHRRSTKAASSMEADLRSRLARQFEAYTKQSARLDMALGVGLALPGAAATQKWAPQSELTAARRGWESAERQLAEALADASDAARSNALRWAAESRARGLEAKLASFEAKFKSLAGAAAQQRGDADEGFDARVEAALAKAARFEQLFEQAQAHCKEAESALEAGAVRLQVSERAREAAEKDRAALQDQLDAAVPTQAAERLRADAAAARREAAVAQSELSRAREDAAIAAQQAVELQAAADSASARGTSVDAAVSRLGKLLDASGASDEHAIVGKLEHQLITERARAKEFEFKMGVERGRRQRLEAQVASLETQLDSRATQAHRIRTELRAAHSAADRATAALLRAKGERGGGGGGTRLTLAQARRVVTANKSLAASLKASRAELQASIEATGEASAKLEAERALRETSEARADALVANSQQRSAEVHLKIEQWSSRSRDLRLAAIKSRREAEALRRRVDFYKGSLAESEASIDRLQAELAEREDALANRDLAMQKQAAAHRAELRELEGRVVERCRNEMNAAALDTRAGGTMGGARAAAAAADEAKAAKAHAARLETKLDEYQSVLKTTKALIADQDEAIRKLNEHARSREAEFEEAAKTRRSEKELEDLERKRLLAAAKERVESLTILLRQKSDGVNKYQRLLREAQARFRQRADADEAEIQRLAGALTDRDEGIMSKLDGAVRQLGGMPSADAGPASPRSPGRRAAEAAEKDRRLASLRGEIQRLELELRAAKTTGSSGAPGGAGGGALQSLVERQKADLRAKDKKLAALSRAVALMKDEMLDASEQHLKARSRLERELKGINVGSEVASAVDKEQARWVKRFKNKDEAIRQALLAKAAVEEKLRRLRTMTADIRTQRDKLKSEAKELSEQAKAAEAKASAEHKRATESQAKRREAARLLGAARARSVALEQKLSSAAEAIKSQGERINALERRALAGGGAQAGRAGANSAQSRPTADRKTLLTKLSAASRRAVDRGRALEASQHRLQAALKDKADLSAKVQALQTRLRKRARARSGAAGPGSGGETAGIDALAAASRLRSELFALQEEKASLAAALDKQSRIEMPALRSELKALRARRAREADDDSDGGDPTLPSLADEADADAVLALRLEASSLRLELGFEREQAAATRARFEARTKELELECETYRSLARAATETHTANEAAAADPGVSGQGLTRVVNALRKVVSRLQQENAMLKKNSFRTQKHLSLQRENKALKRKAAELAEATKQAAKTGGAKSTFEIRRLKDLVAQGRKALRKEQDAVSRLRSKLQAAVERATTSEQKQQMSAKELAAAQKQGSAHSKRAAKAHEDATRQLVALRGRLRASEAEAKKKDAALLKLTQQLSKMREHKASANMSVQSAAEATRHQTQLRTLQAANAELAAENALLKEELGAFDKSFFEEIEDLKYNYEQLMKENAALRARSGGVGSAGAVPGV